MAATPFHFTFAKPAREGVYHLRVYSVPSNLATTTLSFGPKLKDHYDWLTKNCPAVELPGSVITSFAPHQVESENEFEQGIPRMGEMAIEFEPVADLAAIIAASRDPKVDIWIEITLEQPIQDAPAYPGASIGSLTWPWKTRSYFWGPLDRKTIKGKVHSQQITSDKLDSFIRKTKAHDGTLSMSFVHWLKTSSESSVKSMLDSITFLGARAYVSISIVLLNIVFRLNPAQEFYIASDDANGAMTKPQLISQFTIALLGSGVWRKLLDVGASYNGTDFWNDMDDLFIRVTGQAPLFVYDPKGSGDISLYKWKDLAEALVTWCREFFINIQIELPTMEAAAKLGQGGFNQDTAQTFEGSSRVLVQNDSSAMLPLYADIDEDTLEYDPCAAYASSYTVSEPVPDGVDLLPDPPQTKHVSPFFGGDDQSYKTLLRLAGTVNGVISPRGLEIYVKDGSGNFHAAQSAMMDGATFTDWTDLHAYQKINVWGGAHTVLTFTARGVGLQPFGVACTSSGTPITLPNAHYGLMDFGEFPLRRSMYFRPGIFADPAESTPNTVVTMKCITISVKRVPDGGTEYKMIELLDNAAFGHDTTFVTPPPPPPPPPPGKRGGPADTPSVSISPTGLTGPLAGTHTIAVTATNTYGVQQVTVQIDGVMLDTQVAERATGVWNIAFDTTKFSGTLASPVIHTVKAIAYDLGGNTSTATLTVTIAN